MKKILAVLLVALLVVTNFVACDPTVISSEQTATDEVTASSNAQNFQTQDGVTENSDEDEITDEMLEDIESDIATEDVITDEAETKESQADIQTEKTSEETDRDKETNIESGTEQSTEKDTQKETEQSTEKDTQKETEQSTEKDTQKETEQSTEKDTQKETEQSTEKDTDKDVGDGTDISTPDAQGCTHTQITDGFCLGCDKQLYVREGDIICFGEYPQSIKSDSVEIVGTTPDARGYYLGSDNYYYAKVTATPYSNGYEFTNGREIKAHAVYYFKVEPIRWRIVSQGSGKALVLCESILINKAYDASSNAYGESDIYTWLAQSFMQTAFDDVQKQIMLTTLIEAKDEKVFLISESEAFLNGEIRKIATTDFARANGAWMTTSAGKGNGTWWLRNPNSQNAKQVKVVTNAGMASNYELVNNASFGIVPALRIPLN